MIRFFVSVTDNQWFRFLAQLQPDEVNFWRPGGGSFRALKRWDPFLFKLHAPDDFVVGGGFFVEYSRLPLSLAWDVFEAKNGAPDFETFSDQIYKYRAAKGTMEPNPKIGCIVLTEPFFFSREDWIPAPEDWSPSIVQGKGYNTEDPIGRRLWDRVQALLPHYQRPRLEKADTALVIREEGPAYSETLTHVRLGQGAFRVLVTDAYHRRCAMTGERTLPALEASHIKPFSKSGPHRVNNGLLLRADLHRLFDRGYMTVTKDARIEVSRRVKEEYDNGDEYYALHGNRLVVMPTSGVDRPASDFIEWHNERVFIG